MPEARTSARYGIRAAEAIAMVDAVAGLDGLEYRERAFLQPRIWPDGHVTEQRKPVSVPKALSAFHLDDVEFIEDCLVPFPYRWRSGIARSYSKRYQAHGRAGANAWLRQLAEQASACPLPLTADEGLISARAQQLARNCLGTPLESCVLIAQRYHVPLPDGSTKEAMLARFQCKDWWRRNLRKVHGRAVDQLGRELNLLCSLRQIYTTDETVQARRDRKQRNSALMQVMEVVNELGEAFTLAELHDRSLANPVNRRNELMARIAGIDRYAKGQGYEALFLTLTCPSRFHPTHSKTGRPNNQYQDGLSPRDGHAYLKGVWARVRAALHRQRINPMGLRVVEPQQDGTPHWHLLVFVPPENAQAVIDTMQRYALEDTPDEPGASRHRFQVERIDPKRGTATGYIAKYVGKNIDGYGVEADQYGNEATASAERVQAWNSQWGIRQFQFFGTPAIGPYRELRRLRGDCAALPRHAAAADEGDFCRYIELCAAKPLSPFRVWSDELNRYREPKGWQVSGVATDESEILTRFHQWQTRMRQPERANHSGSTFGTLPPWSSVNNCTERPTKPLSYRQAISLSHDRFSIDSPPAPETLDHH